MVVGVRAPIDAHADSRRPGGRRPGGRWRKATRRKLAERYYSQKVDTTWTSRRGRTVAKRVDHLTKLSSMGIGFSGADNLLCARPPPSASRFAWRVAQNLNATSLHATASSTASGQRFYVGPACSSYSDRARGSAQATDPLARARQPSRFAWRVAQNLNATSLRATASSMASGQQFYATLSTQSYSNAPRSPRSQIRPKSGRR